MPGRPGRSGILRDPIENRRVTLRPAGLLGCHRSGRWRHCPSARPRRQSVSVCITGQRGVLPAEGEKIYPALISIFRVSVDLVFFNATFSTPSLYVASIASGSTSAGNSTVRLKLP